MSNPADEAVTLILTRIEQIDEEADGLGRALKELGGTNSRKPAGRPSGGTPQAQTARKPRRRIAKRGQRKEEVVNALKGNPGIKPSALAKLVGIAPTQVHSILKALISGKEAVKDDDGGYSMLPFSLPQESKPKASKPAKPKGSKKPKGKRPSEQAMEETEKEELAVA
jgi:hypothetical protein